jgi:hypothetical protein
MRKLFSALLLTLVATNAFALNQQTKDLLATIAMPLAVSAVAHATGVPETQLTSLVSTLNQANVAPTQFVDVMRYTPVALNDSNGQPFVAYVQDQASQGLTGDALVSAILRQLQTRYNVAPQPAFDATYVVDDNYIPQTVITQLGTPSSTYTPYSTSTLDDPLAYISLPLAVAAVADIAGVPQDQLASLLTTLNNANVPPAQIIEVVRYVPVALVDNGQPFVTYVQQQVSQGVTGPALLPLIQQQLQPYYPATTINVIAPQETIPVTTPVIPQHLRNRTVVVSTPGPATPPPVVPEHLRRRTVVVDNNFVPPVVINRVAEVKQHPMHPHGGPPGQIKKQIGVQTGAEVVHGEARGEGHGNGHGRGHEKQVVIAQPAPAVPPMAQPRVIAPPHPPVVVAQPQGNGRGPGGGGPPGQAKEKEHGNGKGKGKD